MLSNVNQMIHIASGWGHSVQTSCALYTTADVMRGTSRSKPCGSSCALRGIASLPRGYLLATMLARYSTNDATSCVGLLFADCAE